MQLPAIDIPVQIPFDVPVMIHPVVVHFAIVLPVIALLLELVNFKSRNRAISLTSLFLITLTMLVVAAAWLTGKADGSHAAAMLSAGAKEELAEHKLIGTYLVYASAALFVFKLLAMMIRANWMRDIFLILMLVYVGATFKQGKDGGELVYEYGVNVEAVQSSAGAPESEAETETKASASAEAEQPAVEAPQSAEASSADETESQNEAPAVESAQKSVNETVEAVKESANEAVESAKEGANEAVEAVQQSAQEAVESASETAKQTVEGVQESANEAAEAAQEGADKAVESAHEALQNAAEAAKEAGAEAEETAH